MSRLDIDFVRRKRLPAIELILLLAAVALFLHYVAVWRETVVEEQGYRTRVEALARQLAAQEHVRRQRSAEAATEVERRAQQRAGIVASLDYPWEHILAIIEAPNMHGISLQSFNHDAANHEIRLTLDAVDLQTLERYVARLNEASISKPSIAWQLTGYQEQTNTDGASLKAAVSGMITTVRPTPLSKAPRL